MFLPLSQLPMQNIGLSFQLLRKSFKNTMPSFAKNLPISAHRLPISAHRLPTSALLTVKERVMSCCRVWRLRIAMSGSAIWLHMPHHRFLLPLCAMQTVRLCLPLFNLLMLWIILRPTPLCNLKTTAYALFPNMWELQTVSERKSAM